MLKKDLNYQTKLIRVGEISGILYRCQSASKIMVVYGSGAPIVPDNGTLPDAVAIMKYGVDLFVPDYIGYGRSGGVFTPKNCITTFLNLYESFSEGCFGINNYSKEKIKLKHERIIFIGRSLGGTYLPLLPKFNKKITELCLIYPAVNNKVYGTLSPEESNEDFMRAMLLDGYKYLYRGIESDIWKKHLSEKDGLSPMDRKNISHLSKVKMFIGHGDKDTVLHYSRTKNYYDRIISVMPDKRNDIVLRIYSGTGHTFETSNKIVRDYLRWAGVPIRF